MTQSTLDEYQDSGRIDHTDPQTLEQLYWEEGLSISDIAELANRTENPVRHQMEKHDIPRRSDAEGGRLKNDTGHPSIYIARGYWVAASTHNGEKDSVRLNRLLATLLVDELSELNDVVVHHKNEIKWCDTLDNIELKTPEGHMSHHTQGTDHHNSKLTEEDVKEIKRLLNNTNLSQREIGDRFDVDQTAISKIHLGKTGTMSL